jgi:hypothetical protein
LNPAAYSRSGWNCTGGIPVVEMCSGNSPMWGGVLCSAGVVVSLTLTGLGMTGSIPSSVGLLSRLTKLDLHSNSIVGIVPSSFGFLVKIQVMRLDSNSLSGTVPASICNDKALTNINMAGNAISCYAQCLSSVPTKSFGSSQCTSGENDANYIKGQRKE